jgi:hypothetical protein
VLQYLIVQTAADVFRIDATVRFEIHEVDALEREPSDKRSVFVRAPVLAAR